MALSSFAQNKTIRSQLAVSRVVKVEASKKEAAVAMSTASMLASAPTLAAESVDVKGVVETTGNVISKAGEIVGQGIELGQEKGAGALEKSLKETGVDTGAVKSTITSVGGEAVKTGTPLLKQVANVVASTDPVLLAEYGVAAVAVIYLGPTILGGVGGLLRGYGGELSAPSVLDNVCSDGASYVVDIRSARDKEMGGVPDLPGGAAGRSLELEFCQTADRRVRGQLKNPDDVETKMTAMQIAALKRLNKSDTLYLLDTNGGLARKVARELAARGFGKTFVVAGGFQGWTRSKLQVKPASTSSGGAVFGGRIGTVITGKK